MIEDVTGVISIVQLVQSDLYETIYLIHQHLSLSNLFGGTAGTQLCSVF